MTTLLSDSNHHSIHLLNVKNGDTFIHPLCLIRGQITVTDPCCVKGKIFLRHHGTNQQQQTVISSEWDVTEWGVFKCLILLKHGPNQATLIWKCSTCEYDAHLAIQIYHEERSPGYKVLPVWITCQDSAEEDETNLQGNLERVCLMARLAQCVTSECLWEKGFARSSIFSLESKVAVFQSKLTSSVALSMNHEALWQHLARELMSSSIASHQTKYLAFLSCTRYEAPSSDAVGKKRTGKVKGHIALGAGGLALLGTASIHTWPRRLCEVLPHLLDSTPVDTKKYLDDSCRRGTYGGCFATAVGSICHELGHTFDLGHTQSGIMGRGFHHVQKIFTLPSHIEDSTTNRNCSEKLILSKASLEIKKLNTASSSVQPITDINISWSQPRREFCASARSHLKKNKGKQKCSASLGCKKFFKNDEFPFWSSGCAAILAFHRWFNDFPALNNSSETITYNRQMRCLSSTAGLRVVQIRNDSDGGAVMSSWQFLGPQGRVQFLIPSSFSFPEQKPQAILTVMAEDSFGNILKDKL